MPLLLALLLSTLAPAATARAADARPPVAACLFPDAGAAEILTTGLI